MDNISEIVNQSDKISLAELSDKSGNFCNLWPGGKQALQALQTILKNPIAKGSIGIAIAAGDAVFKQTCGKQ